MFFLPSFGTERLVVEMKFIVLFCVAVLIGVFLKYSLRRIKYNTLIPGKKLSFLNVLGDLKDIPLTKKERRGFTHNMFIDLQQLFSGRTKLFREKKMFSFWIAYELTVVLVKADAVKILLEGTRHLDKSWIYQYMEPLVAQGLITSNGAKWKSRRKLLNQTFHIDVLNSFIPVVNSYSRKLVQELQKECEKDFTDIYPLLKLCIMDIACECTFGVKVGALDRGESQYENSISRLFEIGPKRVFNCFYWPDFVFYNSKLGRETIKHLEILHSFSNSIFQEKKSKFVSGDTSKQKVLMDLLLEHHMDTKDLTEEGVKEEIDTFIVAGHLTTATGLLWALYLIGLHTDVQTRIQEELFGIFGDDIQRDVLKEDLNAMEYIPCVVKECQRIYPSVPLLSRTPREDLNICGTIIPKDTPCFVSTYELHRDEEVFPDPEKFDPDRFLLENSIGRHPYAYIPFSVGPRNCIGMRLSQMETKIVLSTILRHFTVESLDQRDKIFTAQEIVLTPVAPVRVRFRSRHSNGKFNFAENSVDILLQNNEGY